MTEQAFEYWYKAVITHVYDGDTCTANISLGCFVNKSPVKLRLFGINAPEIRGEERPMGLIAREALKSKVQGKQVILNTYLDRDDKYGRLLAVIYVDGLNINDWLVSNGYAIPYMV